MDKPTSFTTKLPPLMLVFWLSAVSAGPCLAQEELAASGGSGFSPEVPATYSGAGSFFNRQLGTAFRFNYHSEGYGTPDGVVSLGSMKVFNQDNATIFLDGQATLSDAFGGGFNAGGGYRTLTNTGWGFDPLRIHGVNFWTDGQSTEADNFFTQLGVGLESLGDRIDFRFQGYFPLDRSKDSDPVTVPGSGVLFQGHDLLGALQQFTRDTALTVVDLEGAARVANLEAWAFLGGYHLTGSDLDATGYRAGVRGYAVPDVALSVQVTDDDIYHTNVMFGITWFVGRTHRLNAPCGTLLDRFREPVLRNDFIATTSELIDNPITPLTDAVSGNQFFFVHVDSTAAAGGDGTLENPYNNLLDVQNGSGENNIIFVHSNSVLAGNFTAQDGQRVLGEGLDPNGNPAVHTVNSAEQGIVNLPETSPGSSMGATPIVNGVGTVFELADNNEINNFIINGGVTAVNANAVSNPQLGNLVINSPTGDAIVYTNVTGSSLIANSVTINTPGGRGIVVNGGSGVLGANATINNAAGRAIEISGRGGGSVTVGRINQTAAGVDGIFVHDNTGGNVTFSSPVDVTTAGAGNSAVELTNNTGATISFQDLRASSDTSTTFAVTGGGTVSVADPNNMAAINNTGTGSALVVRGEANVTGVGNPTVTVLANVTNTNGGQAVDIQEMTGGAVSVTGDVTDNDTMGLGIRVENNTAGTYSFAGSTTLDTGTNSAVILRNNTGATVNFTNLDATSAAAAGSQTFLVEGGGTVNVNDPNDTGNIENTGTGAALVVSGENGAGTGNPTVNVAADVTNTGGGRVVDIQGMTGGGVTVSGDVTDTAGTGILVQDNTAGTYAFTGDTTISSVGADNAVTLQNNTGATVNFTNLNASAVDGTTFSVVGGGTVNVTDPNDTAGIQNTGTGSALVVRGDADGTGMGNPTVTIAKNIVNTGGGQAVDIQSMTGGAVSVTGDVTDTDEAGSGILVQNNTAGTYSFAGNTTLKTGANDAVTLRNNTGATVNFTNLIATATDGNTFVVEGGGTVNVNDPNNTSMIINNGTGTAVRIIGDGDATAVGNPTVSIAAEVMESGGGFSVDIEDMTANSVTFTDEINDTNGGILIQNNSADAVITFSDLVTVDTPNNDAIRLLNNTDADISFNGLNIMSNGGFKGFTATGGGNLTVTNVGGTIIMQNGSGTALELVDMNIAAGDVTFDKINVGLGTDDAIILTNLDGGPGGQVVIGSGANPADGGTITTAGTAVAVNNVENLVMNNVRITNSTGPGVNVTGQKAASTAVFNGLEVVTSTADAVTVANNTAGTITFNDLDATTTGTGEAVVVNNNGTATVTFNNMTVSATGGGDGVVITGPGTVSILGTANTIDTVTGAGLSVTNANTTINNTTVNTTGAANAVNITHTAATTAKNSFNNLSVAMAGNRGVNVLANGSAEHDLTIINSSIINVGQEGIFYDLGAAATRTDFTLTNTTITAGNNQALEAVLDDTAGADVRFLFDDNTFNNNSAVATVDIVVADSAVLSATIGEALANEDDPTNFLLGNDFNNTNIAGDSFHAEVNSATAVLNLDLRANRALGATPAFQLDQTAGTFRLVDRDDTVNDLNNQGPVNITGTIVDTNPPLLMPTP